MLVTLTEGHGGLLERLLYCREFRETIRELKSKGDFRPEGLKKPTRLMVLTHLLLLSGILLVVVFFWGEWETLFVLGGSLSACEIMMVLWARGEGLAIIATGDVTEGRLTKVYYEKYFRQVWNLEYQFLDHDGQSQIGSTKINNMYIGHCNPKIGDRVWLFYERSAPNKSRIFIPCSFRTNCISRSRFEQFFDEPFSRGEFR